MLTKEKLLGFGADPDQGIQRCMGNETLYLRLVKMACEDKNFEALVKAAEEDDLKAGFEAAHALKGMLSNLALTPLSQPAGELTELLRARTPVDFRPQAKEILARRERLRELDAQP